MLNTHPINRLSKAGAVLVNTISSYNVFQNYPACDLLCSAGVEQAVGGREVELKLKLDLSSVMT